MTGLLIRLTTASACHPRWVSNAVLTDHVRRVRFCAGSCLVGSGYHDFEVRSLNAAITAMQPLRSNYRNSFANRN